jgi:hypothetical protein
MNHTKDAQLGFPFFSKQLGEGGRKGLGCWWHNNLLKPKMHMKHTKNVQLDFSFLSNKRVGMLVTQHAVYIFSVLVWYQLLNNLVMVSDFSFFHVRLVLLLGFFSNLSYHLCIGSTTDF